MTGAAADARAFVALGSNLGDPLLRLGTAAEALGRFGTVSARSSLWRTEAVGGPAGQPDYLNAVVALELEPAWRDPRRLLDGLLAIEREEGRLRRRRWAARVIDLDLLAIGDAVRDEPGLELPHPRAFERGFVLAPWCEVAGGWRHPRTGRAPCAAWTALPEASRRGVQRSPQPWPTKAAAP